MIIKMIIMIIIIYKNDDNNNMKNSMKKQGNMIVKTESMKMRERDSNFNSAV